MPLDPNEPPRPSRIIIPGAESEPAERPSIVLPTGEPSRASEKPKIVLPPGVALDTPEDLPEFPRLRPLQLMPVRDGERELILVHDPQGVIAGQPVLSMEALPMLQLLDGTVSLQDLSAAVMRESKDLRVGNMIKQFVAQLDEMLMLESPRFERALAAMREAYHPLEIRPAALAAHAYPAEREACEAFVDAHFAEAERWRTEAGEPAPAADAVPRALVVPHLDPHRAGTVIARAVAEIGAAPTVPLRIVVFGTGHSLYGDPYALTRKHFETPLGRVTTDVAFVDAIAAKLGDAAYRAELAHRDEHSIELPVLYLLRRLGDRPFSIVPILCGGFYDLLESGRTPRDDERFEALIGAVRESAATLGGTTLYLAGVDFSHVGPRFGDRPLTPEAKQQVRDRDQVAIAAAVAGDADAWFRSIAEIDDATRICGFTPTYAMLRTAEPGAGRLLRYEQSEELDTSLVSVAAIAWP